MLISKWLHLFVSLFTFYAEAPGGGGDTAAGGGGADTLKAGGGADTTTGGGGQDTNTGSGGQDTTGGSAGKDAIKFPENWREGLALGDQKKLERLSRYATPQAVADALLAMQSRIGAGELRSNVPFPDKGTDAEKAAWRKEQGLPETHDKYELKLRDGITVPPEDKGRIDSFTKALHGTNAPPGVVAEAVSWYYDEVARATAEQETKDTEAVTNTRDALVAEMGVPEFKKNLNLIDAMIDTMPAKVKDLFKHGRLSDGTPIYGNVDAFKGLADWARKINPAGALVPGHGGDLSGSIETEIKKYETMMRDKRSEWNKDTAAQARYQELITARDAAKSQKAA